MKVKIHVLSDLHLEFSRHGFVAPATDADVVVLAGDIHLRVEGMRWAAQTFAGKRIIYVAGNHEFYQRGNLDACYPDMAQFAQEVGIHFLEKGEVMIDGVRFLGATLWTDFELFGANMDQRGRAIAACRDYMADFQGQIRMVGGKFTPARSREIHLATVEWLSGKLAEPFAGETVVVTHHAPARGSIDVKYAGELACAGFVSDLSRLMGVPKVWIHGHCHDSFDYRMAGPDGRGETRVVCNPRGYANAWGASVAGEPTIVLENDAFDPGLVVEI